MFGPRIKAQAIVNIGFFRCPPAYLPFLVTVVGETWNGDSLPQRTYQIGAEDDDTAGRAGLERYVAEMNRVN